jgi:glycosyltransferase involved in cell wall biosynthesis
VNATPPTGAAPPRVLVLSRCTTAFGASRGGADVLSRRHAELLARGGYRVVFVGTSPLETPGVETVEVRTRDLVPGRSGGGSAGAPGSIAYLVNEGVHVIQGTLNALRVLRRRPIDVVVSNSSIATLLLRGLSSPRRLIYYIHDSLSVPNAETTARRSFARWLVNDFLERLAVRSASRLICASDGIATQVRSTGVPDGKVTVMYPLLPRAGPPRPVDLAGLLPRVRRLRPFLLTVGQQTGRKRFDLLIEAMRSIPEPYRLVLVGDGPQHAELERLAESTGLSPRVHFLPNASDIVLEGLYQACAAFVLASENEGFPVTVAEASVHGAPVFVACPAGLDLGRSLDPRHALLSSELTAPAVAAGIRALLERTGPDVELVRPAIRHGAIRRWPTEEEVRQAYRAIFHGLLSSGEPAGPSGPIGPSPLQR